MSTNDYNPMHDHAGRSVNEVLYGTVNDPFEYPRRDDSWLYSRTSHEIESMPLRWTQIDGDSDFRGTWLDSSLPWKTRVRFLVIHLIFMAFLAAIVVSALNFISQY